MDNNKLQNNILEKIKAGEVKMRPRWHFVLRSITFGIFAILLSLVILYITSLVFFELRENGLWFIPSFGFGAARIFLSSLPWLLILVTLMFIIILEVLVRNYSFGYKKPLLYTAFGILVFSLVGGFALAQTSLHPLISGNVYKKLVPAVPKKVVVCSVATTTEDSFSCEGEEENVKVSITPDTRLPMGTNFSRGDRVVIFGDKEDGSIKAKGVRAIEKSERFVKEKIKRDKDIEKNEHLRPKLKGKE